MSRNHRRTAVFALLAAITLPACQGGYAGQNYTPVIDVYGSPGKDPASYPPDLAACQQLAEQRSQVGATAAGAGLGALGGAGAGAIGGAIHGGGNVAEGAALGAALGLLGGGAYSGLDANRQRQDIVIGCMRDRGWRVSGR